MLELMIGIIIGATFSEFWRHLYQFLKQKTSHWMNNNSSKDNSSMER